MNDCDYDKRTALHVAACEGHVDAVRLLVREGADLNITDRYNATPLDGIYLFIYNHNFIYDYYYYLVCIY